MLKINKFIKTAKTFPEITKIRYYTKDERCVKYDCKQPQADVDPREAELREMYIPQVFLPVHPPKPKLYKNIFLFVCLPAIICAFLNTLSAEEPKRPKFVEYAYLRLRTKEYPWDPVRTLFHNPRRNALPTGYEEEVPEDMEYNPLEEQCPHKK